MEGRDLGQQAATPGGKPDAQKYDRARQGATPGLASEAKVYNADADVTATAGKKEKKKVPLSVGLRTIWITHVVSKATTWTLM